MSWLQGKLTAVIKGINERSYGNVLIYERTRNT